ncbi:MAG: hypothetical protein HUJ97_04620 [Bacteroidales bacterium]|nr:hypothetical protein [Bacteroidales bacterium]
MTKRELISQVHQIGKEQKLFLNQICSAKDFIESLQNRDIVKDCQLSWDEINNGYQFLWDTQLPDKNINVDILICKDVFMYSYIIRNPDGSYIESKTGDDYYDDWAISDFVEALEDAYKISVD